MPSESLAPHLRETLADIISLIAERRAGSDWC
jgi:hypothetical protein